MYTLIIALASSNPSSSAHILHKQTKRIFSERFLFEPYLTYGILDGRQIKWMVWTSHFWRPSGQVRLENKNWTARSSSCVHFWVESPVRNKFLLAGASFASTLSNPLNVLFAIRTIFFLDLEITKLCTVMLVSSSPAKVDGVQKPDCSQKWFRRMVSQLFRVPQLLDLCCGQSESFVWFLAFTRATELLSFAC